LISVSVLENNETETWGDMSWIFHVKGWSA